MLYINRKALSDQELKGIDDIIHRRREPECPGCGEPMHLCMAFGDLTDGEYSANYMCNSCRCWMTQTSTGKSAYVCANDAYIKAVTLIDSVRRAQRAAHRSV